MSRLAGSNCFRILQIVTDDFSSHTTGFHSILASFDAIGAQTPALKQAVESASGSPPPVAVLPCFHQIAVVPSSIPSGPPVELGIRLAYFGRLARNKGLHLLLQAIDQLAVPSLTTLDLWGTGPVQLELEQMLYNFPSIASCVSLKGQYPCDREYIELLASYHGLILPSQACEGLPLVLLEAASVGLPILTTRVGGIGDFAEGNPDVLTIDLGLPALRAGLKGFLAQIHRQSFQRSRQQTYFARHYSRTTIEQSWSLILCDAPRFFGIDNGSTPHISHP
jgi:glycosyltransferase involved in cell wall biosynthesis